MSRTITLVDKRSAAKSLTTETEVAVGPAPTIVHVAAHRAQLQTLAREGNRLVLRLETGEVLTLDNFFVEGRAGPNDLVLDHEEGGFWHLDRGAPLDDPRFTHLQDLQPLLTQEDAGVGWLIGAAMGALLAAGAVGGGGGDGGSSQGPAVSASLNDAGTAVSGTTTAGAAVVVKDALGNILAQGTADGSGHFNVSLPAPLAPNQQVQVTATDGAGRSASANLTYVDTLPPEAIALADVTATDDVGAVTGELHAGDTTDDAQPTFSGTGTPGDIVKLYDGDTVVGAAVVDASGHWVVTPNQPLAEGTHQLSFTATDPSGNESAHGAVFDLTVDTTAPTAPSVDPSDGTALSGTAEPGATVNIDLNGDGTPDVSVLADATGAWSHTPSPALPAGTPVTVTATDAAGNTSPATTVTVTGADTTAPDAPVIAGVGDDVEATVGNIADGGLSNDPRPTITGTAEVGSTVTVFDNGSPMGSATADATGHWSFTPSTDLAAGAHSFTAVATDAAGNAGGVSAAYTVNLDFTPPAQPTTIASVSDDVAATLGVIANGGTSNDGQPTLAGTAEVGSTVTVYDNGSPIGTAAVDGAGNWSFTPASGLGSGAHSFTAVASDAAGNAGAPSAAYTVTLDLSAPAAPAIASVSDDVAATIGVVANGGSSNDPRPVLAGTAEAGSTVTVYDNGSPIGTAPVDGSGNWSFTPTSDLGGGAHSFTAVATDAAGNTGPASGAYAVTLDLTAPAAPAIVSVSDDVDANVGIVANGGVTNDSRPTLAGTAEPGSTVTVLDNGSPIGSAVADGAGNWSFTPAGSLPAGAHSFTAVATDAAGNTGPASGAYAVTVDLTAPSATSSITEISTDTGAVGDFVTSDTSLTVSGAVAGSLDAGDQVEVSVDGVNWTTVTVAAGTWSYVDSRTLADGSYTYHTRVVDAAGNAGASSSQVVTVDTTAPTTTASITGLSDDTGTLGDWTTHDTSPTFSGTLSAALVAGERVEVRIDGGDWAQATVSGATWFFGPGALGAGGHTVEARVVDSAGNASAADSQAVTIDNTNRAPIVAVQTSSLLGLDVDLLSTLDTGNQLFVAYDPDGGIKSVSVVYDPLVGINAATLAYSTQLATELGVTVATDNDSLLGLIQRSELTFTKTSGTFSNLEINELLKTLHMNSATNLLDAGLLPTFSISATDEDGVTSTDTSADLLNVGLLNIFGSASGDPTVIEGTAGGDTLTGTAANERLYGYGGDDTLNGGGGNDLLRGGAGADTLNGGDGDDVLVYDATDASIDGGNGYDTLLLENGGSITLDGSTTNVHNIEAINLGIDTAANAVTLTELGVLNATSGGQLVISGDSNDSVTMTGAVFQGQKLIDGHAYDQYLLGTTTVLVEDPIPVVF